MNLSCSIPHLGNQQHFNLSITRFIFEQSFIFFLQMQPRIEQSLRFICTDICRDAKMHLNICCTVKIEFSTLTISHAK